ncbi:vesicle-trafficking protein sec22b [Anaeramoeba flamelloides]|uniref:Vesicle-trafficking protein sec22b n=1 Tax=Anaeramoeba flamelloides TaxID=1746091 RepID=A0ABQ8XCR1_9EUKA|nr:vesicle-trafficking protein sec22b [Anaeramoeba flamelloides]
MYVCMIARIRDGLPLVSCDNEQQDYSDVKTQARKFFKKLTTFDESMSTIDLNDEKHVFHYLLNQGVCYLTYCSKNYPTKLAFSFLSDLRESFNNSQSDQVQTATRPFQLVQFETTKKLFLLFHCLGEITSKKTLSNTFISDFKLGFI